MLSLIAMILGGLVVALAAIVIVFVTGMRRKPPTVRRAVRRFIRAFREPAHAGETAVVILTAGCGLRPRERAVPPPPRVQDITVVCVRSGKVLSRLGTGFGRSVE